MPSIVQTLCAGLLALLCTLGSASARGLSDDLLARPIHLIDGETVSLGQYQGRQPVYLKFWATWCQPCRAQMPHFEQVQQEFGQEIRVIAINLGIQDDEDSVRAAMREFGLSMAMAIDDKGDLAQAFRLLGTPYHLVFDKDMNLIHVGHQADSSLDSALALVAERGQAAILDSSVLDETAADIAVDLDDGRLHGLLFTATWCDWYWEETRPEAARSCVQAQQIVNQLATEQPDIAWQGVINRLWTGKDDLDAYRSKFDLRHAAAIDESNRLFHRFGINELPALLLIKNGKVLKKISDFADYRSVADQVEASR